MQSTNDGQSFIGQVPSIPYVERSDRGPALVSHNGKLLMAWRGSGNTIVTVAQLLLGPGGEVIGYANHVQLNESSTEGPSLASLGGALFIAWKASNGPQLSAMFSLTDGNGFQNKGIFNQFSDAAPAIVAHKGKIVQAWRGSGTTSLTVGDLLS
jgi:hypothetical protein